MVVEIHSGAKLTPSKKELLEPWVEKQRWYQGKGHRPRLHPVSSFRLEDPEGKVGIEVAFVRDLDAETPITYQIPVTYRDTRRGDAEDALIGITEHSALGTRYVYDGCKDPAFTRALWQLLVTGGSEAQRSDGAVHMTVKGKPSHSAADLASVVSSRVLSGEQSNTSIIYTLADGSQAIAKIFRVLNTGTNPDIELTGALSEAGSTSVPRLLASLSGSFTEGKHSRDRLLADLAFAQEFMSNVRDAWREALEAARSDEDFSEQARNLGCTTADIHTTLARTLPTLEPSDKRVKSLLDQMRTRAAAAAKDDASLGEHLAAISARIDAAQHADWPQLQRIHGDYHLGQVLDVPGRGWVALDFEGEPLRPLAERNEPDAAIRDVAGMLRSFDYAGGTIEHESSSENRREWVTRCQNAFIEGYESGIGSTLNHDLLALFVLDKALYEVSYEARNRPDWLKIPASAVTRLLDGEQPGAAVADGKPSAGTSPVADSALNETAQNESALNEPVLSESALSESALSDSGQTGSGQGGSPDNAQDSATPATPSPASSDERNTVTSGEQNTGDTFEAAIPAAAAGGLAGGAAASFGHTHEHQEAASHNESDTSAYGSGEGSSESAEAGTSGGTSTSAAPVPTSELDAILRGEHRDPHRVLGAHVNDGVITFRVIRPMAKSVTVEMGETRIELTHEHEGIWVGTTPGEHMPDYRVVATYEDGAEHRGDDPYRFMPSLGDVDLHLIGEGRHEELWNVLGAHVRTYPSVMGDVTGTAFAVWAPNAKAVRVIGDFNHWDGVGHGMRALADSGVWEIFVPDVHEGTGYKFEILCSDGVRRAKADPMARLAETAPATASKVTSSNFTWSDEAWMTKRASSNPHHGPMSTYEVHLGSWRQHHSYRDLAEHLVNYVKDLGFTHVEFMPVMEHPFPPSWGYHVTSYYAPNSRFGDPDDFKYLVDRLHQADIGVILDWVPGHFATDEWALARFDGEALYEHPDPRRGWHPEWGSNIFDYGRPQVRNFLVANALYWLEEFHADGLRVDGVASMLYLDYARNDGEWVPNQFGGHENLEAVQLLQETNATAYKRTPGAVIIAEESTSWPGITRPTDADGLGFGLKWNMGWMHDSLDYFAHEPVHRQYHHNDLTFALVYAFSEQFVLPISHDEVVHGKGSLLRKMPGDRWQQLANVRAYLGYMWAHPGKQLIFMGSEFAQEAEWADGRSLDWWLLDQPAHYGVHAMMKDLNHVYRDHPALWALDHSTEGFQWLNADDAGRNALTWLRFGPAESDGYKPVVAFAGNFSGAVHSDVRVGLPHGGTWNEIFNSDAESYGGSGVGNLGSVEAEPIPWDGQPFSASITLPPLAVVYFEPAQRPDMSQQSQELSTQEETGMSNDQQFTDGGNSEGNRSKDGHSENDLSHRDSREGSADSERSGEALMSGAPLEDDGSTAGMLDQSAGRGRDGDSQQGASGTGANDPSADRRSFEDVDAQNPPHFDSRRSEREARERAFTPASENVDEPVEHLRDITGQPGHGLKDDEAAESWNERPDGYRPKH